MFLVSKLSAGLTALTFMAVPTTFILVKHKQTPEITEKPDFHKGGEFQFNLMDFNPDWRPKKKKTRPKKRAQWAECRWQIKGALT